MQSAVANVSHHPRRRFENNAGAIVSAVQAKAKLFGLDVSKVKHEHTHNYAQMTDEELDFELATFISEIRAAAGKPVH